VGYILGRTHKMRWALILGTAAATGKLDGLPNQLLQRGSQLLSSSPELAKIGTSAQKLLDAGKAAATTALNSRVESLSGTLQDRVGGLGEALPGLSRKKGKGDGGDGGRGRPGDEAEDQYDDRDAGDDQSDEYEDYEDEAAEGAAEEEEAEDEEEEDEEESDQGEQAEYDEDYEDKPQAQSRHNGDRGNGDRGQRPARRRASEPVVRRSGR